MLPRKRRPTHPGEMLREDFLSDYGLTASGFAKALGVSRRTVNELLRERCGVSARMALFLSRFFGNSPEFWLNAQRAVDLWDALQTNRKMINRIVPLKHIRDGMIIEREAKKLNKEASDVVSYQVPISDLEKGYPAMAMDEEREAEALEWVDGVTGKSNHRRTRLARECAKVDPRVEKAFAEEGMRPCSGCRRRRSYNQASREMKPRQGWSQRFRAMAERGDDKLLDVE